MKSCYMCKIEKPSEDFYKHKSFSDGLQKACKKCWKDYTSTDDRKTKRNITNLKNNIGQKRSQYFREYNFKKKYGISVSDYNKMRIEQWHCCKICHTHEDDTHNGLYVDHCHKTGSVRGLLCKSCNAGIGLLKENKTIMQNALEYI